MIDNKKSSLVLILKVLEEYSDENHYLTQKEIISKVYDMYNISLERKSVSNSLNLLMDLDYDINKSPKGGYALLSRQFDASEVRFLNDAIFSSKAITGKQASQLSKKVYSCLSKYQREDYSYILKSGEISRTDNSELFLNVETIQEAIKQNKMVSFQYITYDQDGNKTTKWGKYRYKVSPYYLVNNFGKYYLLCSTPRYGTLSIYRIDYVLNVQVEDTPLIPIRSLDKLKDFDISKYLNEHIYLFSSEVVDATLLINEPNAIQCIDDWFGKSAKIYKSDNKLYVNIKCNEDALFYWILQYGKQVKLLSPTSLVNRLKEHLNEQIKMYQ